MPKLSIEIPVFNGQEFLPERLDSLLTQTFREFEIVAVSDPSPNAFPRALSRRRNLSAQPARAEELPEHRQKGLFAAGAADQGLFGAPSGKPIGARAKAMRTAMVAAHCVKTTARALARKDARDGAQGSIWRNKRTFGSIRPGAMPTATHTSKT